MPKSRIVSFDAARDGSTYNSVRTADLVSADGNSDGELLHESRIEVSGDVLIDAVLEQGPFGSGVDDDGSQRAEIFDCAVYDVDGLVVGLREQQLVHEFAQHADPTPFRSVRFAGVRIAVSGRTTKAISGQIVLLES